MMKFISALVLFSLSVTTPSIAFSNYVISSEVYENHEVPFSAHIGSGEFDSYLIMNIQFDPVYEVFEELQEQTGLLLKN